MLEQEIKRCADALERIADAQEAILAAVGTGANGQEKPAPVETIHTTGNGLDAKPKKKSAAASSPAPAPAAAGAPTPTLDDLTDALRELVGAKGVPAARAVLQKYGADKISVLKVENYQSAYDDLKKAKA